MKPKTLFAAGAAGLLLSVAQPPSPASAAECGDISIAVMNWPSAELLANIDAVILEEGYGCSVELTPGDTSPTFTSMNEKGAPDVAPELWVNAVREPLKKAIEEGRLHSLLDGPISGLGEGWWVTPSFAKEHPELDTVEKVLAHPELFPYAEDESKGAFMGCPSGWGCQPANANLFRAFEMEKKGWVLVDPGSAAGLDGAIAKAAERGEPWFGYYWSPTAIIGKYNLQPLPFETKWAGSENWDGCIVKPEQECLDPKPSSWTKSEVHTVVTDRAKKVGGPAMDYLSKRVVPGEVINAMLVWMTDEQAEGETAAYKFLEDYEDIWSAWIPAEVAAKVKKKL